MNLAAYVTWHLLFFVMVGAILFLALPACEFEDSHNCRWNAQTMGNGEGRSFIDVAGITFY